MANGAIKTFGMEAIGLMAEGVQANNHDLFLLLMPDLTCIVSASGNIMCLPYKERILMQKARSGFPERASLNMAPLTGLEPVTYGLTVRRSTD